MNDQKKTKVGNHHQKDGKSPHPQPCQFPHAIPRAARGLWDLRCADRVTKD